MGAAPPAPATLRAPGHWQLVDFISDLHLKPEEPATFEAWARYMRRTTADAVFILGDLFEAWIGDDAAAGDSFEARCGKVLDACTAELAFMHGNRDFLVGTGFLTAHGLGELADPTVLLFAGTRLLLSHGDLLCTADTAYQEFRRQVRSARWQQAFLAKPLSERRRLAREMRAASMAHHGGRGMDWAPVDEPLARRWLQAAGACTLIHGHTHQPADHVLPPDGNGRPLARIVLSDWHVSAEQRRAEVLRVRADGARVRLDPAAL